MGAGHLHGNGVSGSFPQYGAIFMADNFTRKECFSRNLFGLPSNFSDFVMEVKTGMPLFLFDYQERKLYGVFEASSDGAMNIVPHAYKSSRKQFPAQVRFSIIWRCAPLPECDFRDAIEENYFAPYKFSFGLSKNQVRRLLYLFEERKSVIQNPRNLVQENQFRIKSVIQNPRSLVQENQFRINCQQMKSSDESQPKSLDNPEPLPNSMPEKAASLGVSDVGIVTDSNDYIPLPSIGPEEIKSLLPDGFDGIDYIPLASVDHEESENPLPDGLDSGSCDAFEWDSSSLFPKVGECLLKGDMRPSALECDNREEDDKLPDNGSGYDIRGLYSDSSEERSSVFLRLSGLSRLIKEKQSLCEGEKDSSRDILKRLDKRYKVWEQIVVEEMDSSREILKRLDKRYEVWEQKGAERAPSSNMAKPLKTRTSVFSRLSVSVGKAPKSERKRLSAAEIKQVSRIEGSRSQNLKRKKSTMKTAPEVEGVICRNEKSDSRVSRKEKKRRLKKNSSKVSQETKSSDQCSTMLELSQGSPASTVHTGSSDGSSKSSTVIDDRDSVLSESKYSMKFPIIFEGCRSGEGSVEGDESCPKIAAETPLNTNQQCLSGSSMIEEPTKVSLVMSEVYVT